MNLKDSRYSPFALVQEMLETPNVVRNFKPDCVQPLIEKSAGATEYLFSGEGSSRIFPSKRTIASALQSGFATPLHTEGATQAQEYDLSRKTILAASNSGKTKEVIRLFSRLKEKGHGNLLGVTANPNTPLESLSNGTVVLRCGPENAVAATKSVMEQALVYHAFLAQKMGTVLGNLSAAGDAIQQALEMKIPAEWTEKVAAAPTIFFAGKNNGVAEELTLKTNEITRKKSGFLEGTYAVHGIEEVMLSNEVVIAVDPFEAEEEKFFDVLCKGVGLTVIAISSRTTRFPTLKIPTVPGFDEYIQLAAGWNLLVEVGISLGINLDKPVRARKVGNEFLG